MEERALQLSNIGEHRLKEALAESRAAIRRAGGFLGAAKSPARAQALAVMSVVCERELGLRPTLTQIATSLALHEGHVVELDAGEARALPNALAAILFSWGGSPCHVVHSNDYQAGRDAAAMQALSKLGLADKLAPRIVQGENIGQAQQFVATGNAELGFVALSQVSVPGKPQIGSLWLVPTDLYTPIRQNAVLLNPGANRAAAQALLKYLQSDAAKAVIQSWGYGL